VAVSEPLAEIPVVRTSFARTVRLVTSARLRAAVLAGLVDGSEIAALAEIEGATSQRLLAEDSSAFGIGRDDLVHGVPFASFINASFAYFKPGEPNRFNFDRGAWYCALDVDVCLAEVSWHMTEFLARAGRYHAVVEYAELYASLAGEFYDMREMEGHPALHPDPAIGYPEGNRIALDARSKGLNGVIYPSVRKAGGICIVAILAHAVQSVAQGGMFRMVWSGTPVPAVERLA
jgi:RES domain